MDWRLGPTLLIVALAAVTLAPAPGRTDVLRLVADGAPASYATLASAGTPEMMRRIAAAMAQTLDAPLPSHVILHVYPTPATFAHGLVRDVGLTPRVALDLASSAIGLARGRTIVLLEDRPDDDRIRLVAHEVMHLVQHELAGPGARPAQWMMEGTAEWAALTLLERLGVDGTGARIAAARAAARRYLAGDPAFTPRHVRRSADFRRWQRRVGDLVAYQVVYALADELVARHGVPAVVRYFRAFRHEADVATNFRRAFGIPADTFAADARAALRLAAPARRVAGPRDGASAGSRPHGVPG